MRPKTEVRRVLDASAVLAYLQREPGYARVRSALSTGASISTVNLAEVSAKVAIATRYRLSEASAQYLAL
ncbi:MAG TPA: hypothetical protein VGY99_25395 [Candidatus Binataceae bacterium]|nr:hypothetical protein [Candidatus Binataceae bacterium]